MDGKQVEALVHALDRATTVLTTGGGKVPYTGATQNVNLGTRTLAVGDVAITGDASATGLYITADQTGNQYPFIIDGGALANGDIFLQGVPNSRLTIKNTTTAVRWFLSNNVAANLDSFSIGTASNPASAFSIWQTTGTQAHIANVQTSGATTTYAWTKPNNTGQTVATEVNFCKFTGGTRAWAAGGGTLGSQREFYITGVTHTAATNSMTITNASGLYVEAPIASTNIVHTNNYGVLTNGSIGSDTLGKFFALKEGSGGRMGQVALVAGTKAITITGVTVNSRAFITLVIPNTVAATIQYQAVCTANTLTLQANIAAGTINVADISTLNYVIYEPS